MSDASPKPDVSARPVNRRDALRLLGTAGLMAAATPLARAQPAPVPPAPAPAASLNGNGFYRQRIGEMTATVVSDGTAPLAAVLPTWGANPDRQDEFAATLAEYRVPATNTVNHFNPVVLEVGGRRVLIDTGRGGAAGQLLANLGRAGIDPASIDTVFITHGHGDHIGGLTTNGQPTFPGARHMMGAAEFQFWTTQQSPNAAVQANLIGLRDRFTLIQPGAEIVSGVTAVATPGHTLGHLSVRAGSGSAGLLVFGDAAGHFLLSLRHRGAYISFDTDGALAARTRQRLFNEAVEEGLWVTGYHFPFHAIGHLRRQGLRLLGGYEFEPALWQWE
ncbi:MBL fold metallo-hydrolase [Deinococcus murrayi]|uniref:MBL fold metallo-hydrolase n=1 Tax=Deinococcus murrayi TaxID=68910 RepID=UPI0004833374|nr:MBL fold metallo-hydrolase [Deinococcus murrayi]